MALLTPGANPSRELAWFAEDMQRQATKYHRGDLLAAVNIYVPHASSCPACAGADCECQRYERVLDTFARVCGVLFGHVIIACDRCNERALVAPVQVGDPTCEPLRGWHLGPRDYCGACFSRLLDACEVTA